LRRLTAAMFVSAIAASLLLPVGIGQGETAFYYAPARGQSDATVTSAPPLDSVSFPVPIDTSQSVAEYPAVARALMLAGGSTYSTLADINRDNQTDLVVAVSDAKLISIFYRQSDGNFLSYPSANITLDRTPIGVAAIDAFSKGILQIMVLEKRTDDLDAERLLIFNYTSPVTPFYEYKNLSVFETATSFSVGNLNGDSFPDIALVCPGLNPTSNKGDIEIRLGPAYTTYVQIKSGRGPLSLSIGNFSSDGLLDIAVANYYDRSVNVFFQPFSLGNPPDYNMTVTGAPVSLATGDLNADDLDDIAVVTEDQQSLLFFFQSLGSLQTSPDPLYSRSLSWESPSSVFSADMNADGLFDLAILSEDRDFAYGILQRASGNIWPFEYDFMFPTGSGPRHVLVGTLDSGPGTDIAISSARSDWTGSSIALYPSEAMVDSLFSNANSTYVGELSSITSQIALGDLDGDGYRELVLLYPANDSLEFVSSSSGQGYNKSLGFTPSDVIVADFDGDGFDDIVVSKVNSSELMLTLGKADLSTPLVFAQLSCGGNATAISSGDFNNDSMIDLAATTTNGQVDIFFNSGIMAAPYTSPFEIIPAPGISLHALAVGDFNSDGLDDIAYSMAMSAYINVSFQRHSSPYFLSAGDAMLYHTVGSNFTSLWAGDLTGDGKTDIAAMFESDSSLYFFDQDDFLTSRVPYLKYDLPEAPRFVTVVDATDDGFVDVVASFTDADLLFLFRQSAGVVPTQPSMVFVTGAMPNYAVLGEIGLNHRQSLVCSDSQSHSVSVWEQVNVPPVAEAGGPYSGTEDTPIHFVGNAVDSLSQMPNMQYHWIFGDGNSSSWSSSPSEYHVYEFEGSYSVTLEVMDPCGATASDGTTVNVFDSAPIADFYWSPATPVEGDAVTITENTTSSDSITLINWTINGLLVSSGMEHSITLTKQNGSYTVILEVTDNDGSIGSISKVMTVLRSAPQIKISAPTSATEDEVVTFVAAVDPWHSGSYDSVVSYEWNFSYAGSFVVDSMTAGNSTTWSFMTRSDSVVFTVVVRATDNDGDQSFGFFNITVFDRTKVSVEITSLAPYFEFDQVNFTAVVDASHPATLYEWQFDADTPSAPFAADESTLTGSVVHWYNESGTFLVKVKATVSNGSWAIASIYLSVEDVLLSGTFDDYVTWERNPNVTSIIRFDASALADKYPDISGGTWDYGDLNSSTFLGAPDDPVTHRYTPNKDYTAWLNITDDDGTTLSLSKILKLSEPSIVVVSPADDTVIQAGIPIRFVISDDSPPLSWVKYTLNGGSQTDFVTQWELSTAGWADGDYSLVVRAADKDGNIANRSDIVITVDGQDPIVELLWTGTSVYGGSTMNITINVTESNIDPTEVILFVKVPGAGSFSQIRMGYAGGQTYYALVEVPKRGGALEFHINVTDLADNSADTEVFSVSVKLHFMDVALPYLLALAVLAALGTAGYFFRESKIAVDETFVIYNDGRLIAHTTRHLKPGMDDQVLSGMFAAIQDFVKDSFKDVTSFTLRKLEFGEKSILIEKGDHLFLAVILHGKASKKVASKMARIVDEIEEIFSPTLRDWDGDLDALRGVSDIAKKLYSKAPLLPPFRKPDN
jgi:hypothetical protein